MSEFFECRLDEEEKKFLYDFKENDKKFLSFLMCKNLEPNINEINSFKKSNLLTDEEYEMLIAKIEVKLMDKDKIEEFVRNNDLYTAKGYENLLQTIKEILEQHFTNNQIGGKRKIKKTKKSKKSKKVKKDKAKTAKK